MSETVGYAKFVRAQQDAVLREFFEDPGNCFVGIPDTDAFKKRYGGKGSVRPLPGNVAISKAFIRSRGPGTDELWVRPYDKALKKNGTYRNFWEAFVASQNGGTVSFSIGGRAQAVDHLLPETFAARQGYGYVRVIMIDYRANATVGSTVEASMARRETPGKSMLADGFTAAKASCFHGSFATAAAPTSVMAALRAHFANRGFTVPPAMEAEFAQSLEQILAWSRTA